MDPSQLAPHSDATLALLMGAAVAVVKVFEKGYEKWLSSRHRPAAVVCRLDPEASSAVAETLRRVSNVEEIVDRRDTDGGQLVYPGKRLAEVRDEVEGLRAQAESQHEQVMRAVERRRG